MTVATIRNTMVVDLLDDADMTIDDTFLGIDQAFDDLPTLDRLIDDRVDGMTGTRPIVMSTTCADDHQAFVGRVTPCAR